jgi:hypothetical protein
MKAQDFEGPYSTGTFINIANANNRGTFICWPNIKHQTSNTKVFAASSVGIEAPSDGASIMQLKTVLVLR